MRPKKQDRSLSDDLFRHHLDNILDHRHALYRLAAPIDGEGFDAAFGRSTGNSIGRPSRPEIELFKTDQGTLELDHR